MFLKGVDKILFQIDVIPKLISTGQFFKKQKDKNSEDYFCISSKCTWKNQPVKMSEITVEGKKSGDI